MRIPRALSVLATGLLASLVALVPAGPAAAESTGPTPRQLVSRIGSAGVRQSEIGPGRTDPGSVNGDGDVIAFTTPANGPGDTNGTADVYVRDRRAGTTTLISARPGGGAASLGGRVPSISTDGRYVGFVSESPDLVTGDSGVTNDVFVRDRVAGTTTRIDVEPGGARAGTPTTAVISPDGKVVAWQGTQGIWVRSWRTSTTITRVLTGTSASLGISLSGDGRYLAYVDTDGTVVRRDLTMTGSGAVVAVSTTPGGARRPGRSPAIDLGGDMVGFLTDAADLGSTPLAPGPSRFATRRFSTGDPVALTDIPVTAFAMAPTGIAYALVTSAALSAEDTDAEPDVYAIHVNLGAQFRLVSEALPPTPSTAPGRPAWNPEISGDGLIVTLVSSAVVAGSASTVAEPRRWAVSALPGSRPSGARWSRTGSTPPTAGRRPRPSAAPARPLWPAWPRPTSRWSGPTSGPRPGPSPEAWWSGSTRPTTSAHRTWPATTTGSGGGWRA